MLSDLSDDQHEHEHDTDTVIEKYACPECSVVFAGKEFLNIHMKKLHPNVRVIIQKLKVKPIEPPQEKPKKKRRPRPKKKVGSIEPPEVRPPPPPPKPKVKPVEAPKKPVKVKGKRPPRMKLAEREADIKERTLPPELASKIIKFHVRPGYDYKHLTFNGYEFRPSKKPLGNTAYWKCEFPNKCLCTLNENMVDGTYKRGRMGWAMDGLTHLAHPPEFKLYD